QIGRERRKSLKLPLSKAVFERQILTFSKSHFPKTVLEGRDLIAQRRARSSHHESDGWRRLLLRECRERPSGRTADECDELAPPHHSITWSARPSSESGTVRPSAFAVFMFITSSILLACCTGKSAGLSPLRTRPT